MTPIQDQLLQSVGGLDNFVRSFSWRTFSPDRRAAQAISDAVDRAESGLAAIVEAGATAEQQSDWLAGFVRHWAKFQHAGARTANWMITGPARFPVERNRQRMEIERKRYEEFDEFANGAAQWMARRNRSHERALLSEQAKAQSFKEELIAGVRCVHNVTLNRLQLLFDGKPGDATRASLKGNGFRWSPREGAWQRHLNNNGICAARRVLAGIAATSL